MKRLTDTERVTSTTRVPEPRDRRQEEQLARRIDLLVRRATGQRVRDLRVDVQSDSVRLRGQCETFYAKQLAQHAAMSLLSDERLYNEIQVP